MVDLFGDQALRQVQSCTQSLLVEAGLWLPPPPPALFPNVAHWVIQLHPFSLLHAPAVDPCTASPVCFYIFCPLLTPCTVLYDKR